MAIHDADADPAGLLGSDSIRTGYVRGLSGVDGFNFREVTYAVVDGQAVFEGCILLGPVAEMEKLKAEVEDNGGVDLLNKVEPFGIVVLPRNRWPKGIVPYRIDDALADKDRVHDAIAHWTHHTDMLFTERTDETDFVAFVPGAGCAAHVGRIGGEQIVQLGPNCTTGNTIHEIGHAIGLWHEQCRSDRDCHITVHLENVIANMEHNFEQHIHDGEDMGAYDTASIMHYGTHFFSKNGEPTITTRNGDPIGQRDGLSDGDIATIAEAYASEYAKR